MKKVQKIEKLMALNSRHNNPNYFNAYQEVLKKFGHEDELHKSNHCNIMHELYNLPKRNKTLVRIAIDMGVSDTSLRRYRKEYADWFCYYLKFEQACN